MMSNFKDYSVTVADTTELLSVWSFLENPAIQPTNQGTVNTTFFVDAPDSGKFVLKLYDDSTTTAQIKYEHSLLAHLQSADLSFAVPAPIPDAAGETLLMVNKNNSSLRFTLQNYIPGQPANRQNIYHLRSAGEALGELHRALGEFDSQGKLAHLPPWGELNLIHPLITNPLEVILREDNL
ncbi:MAG: phosphotransferase [Nostocales cyanobacterium 94392]|nr:phosphotransferase [Nostocales cyanobacterium 94392]